MAGNLPVRSERNSPRSQGRSSDVFGTLFGFDPFRNVFPALSGTLAMGMEVSRTEGGYTVEMPVPGFRPEQIEVTLQGDTLSVSGKSERHRFMRTLTLPEEIDPDGISANVEHGMLVLRLKERPEVAPRRIEVQSGQATVQTVSGETTEQRSTENAASGNAETAAGATSTGASSGSSSS